jgi:hypothetical protein
MSYRLLYRNDACGGGVRQLLKRQAMAGKKTSAAPTVPA